MKVVHSSRIVPVPKGVTVKVSSREVTIEGKLGKLVKSFRHMRVDITVLSKRQVKVEMWNADRKQLAGLRSVCSHMKNMITGVTKGFLYKMRMAYNHFPINVDIKKDGDLYNVEVRNFIGQKIVGRVACPAGVTVIKSDEVKDQIELTGIDINDVSQTAAQIHQTCLTRNKDIRKFLDGVYVSEKGPVGKVQPI